MRQVALRVACFVALGVVLLAARRAAAPAAPPPPLIVTVPRGADEAAVRAAIVEAVLVEEAVRARWPLADPIVRERAQEVDATGDAEVARRLVATDPVTRARLAWLGRELVRARVSERLPTAREADDYRAAHADRYAPGWVAFRQRAIGRARHGDAAPADARALAEALAGAGPDAPGGDPTLLPARAAGTAAAIDARFGAGFAARVAAAPAGRWSEPVEGTFGLHVVWREDAAAPPGGAADDLRVARDWAHDEHEEAVRAAIDGLVRIRRIELREAAP